MKETKIHRGTLLADQGLDREYRQRKKERLEKSIGKMEEVPDGWSVFEKEFKTVKKVFKPKTVADQHEDDVWCLFYELGFKQMSSRSFAVELKDRNGIKKTKQLDVVAVDSDHVFVVECKSKQVRGKRQLKRDLAEFVDNMRDTRNAIKKIIGDNKTHVVFVFATHNIEWYDNDKLDAEDRKIVRWDEYDVLSLRDLAQIAGEGGKYQIYNRIFFGKKIKQFQVKIPAIKAKMGGLTYYSFVTNPEHLLKIGFVNTRSGKGSFLELSSSYQRMIRKARLNKIQQFISDGGYFPGSIILNFVRGVTESNYGKTKELSEVQQAGKPVILTLPPYYASAWIIDGQHRLYGYADVDQKHTETLPVIAFTGLDDTTQARMFSDINKNQKPIEADLLWDLCEDLYANSQIEKEIEAYSISRIAKRLNEETSPFNGEIRIPKEGNLGHVSLTTVCTAIRQLGFVSKNSGSFYQESKDATILFASERIIIFFDVIRNELLEEWNKRDRHYVNTNSGIIVLLGILSDLLQCNLSNSEIANLNAFRKSIQRFIDPLLIHLLYCDSGTIASYRGAGGAGQKSRQVRAELTKVIQDAHIGFRSIWLEQFQQALKGDHSIEKKKSGVSYYLDKEETSNLEYKGSLSIDIDRLLKGDGKVIRNPDLIDEGVIKTLVAFLNSQGGELLIGILERHRYSDVNESKLEDYHVTDSKILIGIELEYDKGSWDTYLQRLTTLIVDRISPDVIDSMLVKIKCDSFQGKDICIITVDPAEAKQYSKGKFFYVRRENTTMKLEGQAIDKYWNMRSDQYQRNSPS